MLMAESSFTVIQRFFPLNGEVSRRNWLRGGYHTTLAVCVHCGFDITGGCDFNVVKAYGSWHWIADTLL